MITMKSIDIYHGSDKEIIEPKLYACKTDNDFGSGFYTTESVESARDWALVNSNSGESFCNHYTIDLDDLAIVDLNEYGILAWMRYSSIRRRMDEGNWSALNKSGKQLYNDIPIERCEKKKDDEEYDDIWIGWMTDIYVLMQWKYNIPSAQLSEAIPASEMCRAFHPLYEASYNNACIKLHHKYLE